METNFKTEYIVNKKKRTVVALLRDGNRIVARGKAKCHPDDTWDEKIGKKLASLRAQLAKLSKALDEVLESTKTSDSDKKKQSIEIDFHCLKNYCDTHVYTDICQMLNQLHSNGHRVSIVDMMGVYNQKELTDYLVECGLGKFVREINPYDKPEIRIYEYRITFNDGNNDFYKNLKRTMLLIKAEAEHETDL
jgi:hypothetical protein